jgi:hypothetical protein
MQNSKDMSSHSLIYSPISSIGFKQNKDDFSIYFSHKLIIVPPLLIKQKPLNKPNYIHWFL